MKTYLAAIIIISIGVAGCLTTDGTAHIVNGFFIGFGLCSLISIYSMAKLKAEIQVHETIGVLASAIYAMDSKNKPEPITADWWKKGGRFERN